MIWKTPSWFPGWMLWKWTECGCLPALLSRVTWTVSPWVTRITGPGMVPLYIQPAHLMPLARSITFSSTVSVNSLTRPGLAGSGGGGWSMARLAGLGFVREPGNVAKRLEPLLKLAARKGWLVLVRSRSEVTSIGVEAPKAAAAGGTPALVAAATASEVRWSVTL